MDDLPKKHIKTLTIFRFIAAFMVFGYHFFNFQNDYILLNRVFHRGYLGVDFFFLLSGFVLGFSYFKKVNDETNCFSKKKFFINRFSRIFPVYYLALLISLPIFIVYLNSITPTERFYAVTSAPLSLLFMQSFSGLAITQLWNVPSWSLSVEIFFYLIFPFISFKILRSKNITRNLITLFLINACIFYIVANIPTSLQMSGNKWETAFKNFPLFHLPQFLIGNSLSLMFFKNKNLNLKISFMGFIVFSIFLFSYFLLPASKPFLQSGNPILIFIFSGFILFGALIDRYINKYLPLFLVLLGEASYSLYILQAPIKVFLQQIWSRLFKINYVDGFTYAAYLSTFAIIASVLSFKLIEIPMRGKFIAYFTKNKVE